MFSMLMFIGSSRTFVRSVCIHKSNETQTAFTDKIYVSNKQLITIWLWTDLVQRHFS